MSDELRNQENGRFLDPSEVASLLQAVHESSVNVRIATLGALIRLPLAPSDWEKVESFAVNVLESSDSSAERRAVIEASPFIPSHLLHKLVARLAKWGEENVRAHAAQAMADFRDPPMLVAKLSGAIDKSSYDPVRTAQRLVMTDVSAVRDALRQLFRTVEENNEIRFWLAVALARSGEDAELRAIFASLQRGKTYFYADSYSISLRDALANPLGFYGNYDLLRQALVNRPFPEPTARWLSKIAQRGKYPSAKALAAALLEASTASPLSPPWAQGAPLGFTMCSSAELAEARLVLQKHGLGGDTYYRVELTDSAEFTGLNEQIMTRVIDQGLLSAAITVLFEWIRNQSGWFIGNNITGWIARHAQGFFRPDLSGLFNEYRRLAVETLAWSDQAPSNWSELSGAEGGPRAVCWQIGWTLSRGGLPGLVPGLAGHLTADDEMEQMVAAWLIADAADYVLQPYAAQFGGGSGPEPLTWNHELLGPISIPLVSWPCHYQERNKVCGAVREFFEEPATMPPCRNPHKLTSHLFAW
jgi:hypothetical protein